MALTELQQKIWQGSIPLEIRLAAEDCRTYDESHSYMIQYPRLSYLPFLLPRLHDFFSPSLIDSSKPSHQAWFSFDGVPMKWQHPVGLLFDLFSGHEPASSDESDPSQVGQMQQGTARQRLALQPLSPWKLELHYSQFPDDHLIQLDAAGKVHHDAYMNSVKEADFLRNGTAKTIMSLSKDNSTRLWQSVEQCDLSRFNPVNNKFLNPSSGLPIRHVPIKVYLPSSGGAADTLPEDSAYQTRGSLKVVQTLVPPMLLSRLPQTIGTALHTMLPTVFPSRRSYIHALAVLHGTVVPPNAPISDLMHGATYADGFLHIAVVMVI